MFEFAFEGSRLAAVAKVEKVLQPLVMFCVRLFTFLAEQCSDLHHALPLFKRALEAAREGESQLEVARAALKLGSCYHGLLDNGMASQVRGAPDRHHVTFMLTVDRERTGCVLKAMTGRKSYRHELTILFSI